MRRRGLTIGLVVAAIVLLGMVVVFAFGTPQSQTPVAQNAIPATPQAGDVPQVESPPAATGGEVPAPDPGSPLAIEIPGCVCHSDDPAVVEEHAEYRMNQCFGCHAEGVPGMGG